MNEKNTALSSSRLTIVRPDIWQRGLAMATALTGYRYLPKLPLPDGTIFACGGYNHIYIPAKDTIDAEIKKQAEWVEHLKQQYPESPNYAEAAERELERLKRARDSLKASVLVPEGEMEWLLHEVGHWLASTPQERAMPNYGDGHELEAWAFEQMVLGPIVGKDARLLAPPTQRDGTAFDWSGPLPDWAFRHIDRCVHDERVDVAAFRALWSEWVRWGLAQGHDAPWSI